VIDVVGMALAVVQLDQPLDDLKYIVGAQDAHLMVGRLGAHLGPRILLPQILVQLIAANLSEIVATRVEQQRLNQAARVLQRRRVAGAQALV
jgi:ribosomal protein L1